MFEEIEWVDKIITCFDLYCFLKVQRYFKALIFKYSHAGMFLYAILCPSSAYISQAELHGS